MSLLSILPKAVTKKSKRIGRGGNRGKNAGKGNKGQVKRAGKTRVGFEGGQKSLIRRIPKIKGYNFTGKNKRQLAILKIADLDRTFDSAQEISIDLLKEKGLISKFVTKVRIIKSGETDKKFTVSDSENIYLTKGAKELIKS